MNPDNGIPDMTGWEDDEIEGYLQHTLDNAFPEAVNFRIIPTQPGHQPIDSVTACLTIIGIQDRHPEIVFYDALINGKDFHFTATIHQLQCTPFPRYELRPPPSWGARVWVWPRHIPAEHADYWNRLRANQRDMARTCTGWHGSADAYVRTY